MCYKYFPDNFSSYEEYVKYLKEKNFALEAAECADQHPRKGLWDAEKVTQWLKENFEHYAYNSGIDEVIVSLTKAMEE